MQICIVSSMAMVSMTANQQQQNSTEGSHESRFSRSSSGGARSSAAGSSRGNMVEIVEEEQKPFGPLPEKENSILSYDMEEKTFVAVGKEFKESISSLVWTLRKYPTLKKLVLVHVHRPTQWIPIMGGKFLASQLESQQVNAYRQQEKQKLDKILDEYESFCKLSKVQVEKLVIEMDDVAKGLVELITQNGITKLVMGAAANKHYSKKMKALKSKTACTVEKEAPPSCKIWFVCKENLICTREANSDGYEVTVSPMGSSGSRSSLSVTPSVPQSCHLSDGSQDLKQSSGSYNACSRMEVDTLPVVGHVGTSTSQSRLNADKFHSENWEGTPETGGSEWSLLPRRKEEISLVLNSTLTDEVCKDGSIIVQHPRDDLPLSSTQEQLLGESSVDDDWNIHLQQAITEATNLVSGAYKESYRRRRAERDAFEANQRIKALESNYAKEIKLREEVEQILAREKVELEKLKTQLDDVLEELQDVRKQKAILKDRITESDGLVKDLEEKLSALKNLMNSLQKERDVAVNETELQRTKEAPSSSTNRSTNFLEFSYLELEQATCNFESSLKIGEGGSGSVYKGYISHTKVAIKVLDTDSLQDGSDFRLEVDNLSRLRHPNLVTLIGACPEAFILVYEFLPNGSLEDRLSCKNNTPPLPWQIRIRISAEICSALIFLHSNKPNTVVHGDLRPANILLDVNFVSKLSDFSISRLLVHSTTSLYNWTDPKGNFVYMDPEFFSTGEIRPHSDIYSFGIILIRLLTGRPALGVVKEVQEALEKGKLQKILDPAAGDWPFKQAQQLALLGLKCCEMKRKNRPDLVGEVLKILEPIKLSTWA